MADFDLSQQEGMKRRRIQGEPLFPDK